MKRILVIGAAGVVGVSTISYLLNDNKYEITALDLKNKKTTKKLKKYKKKINIVEGDVNDSVLMDSLVKDHDIIINLSTVLPPLAEYHDDLAEIIEYNGTENIIRAINYFNPKCTLIYGSSTSVYGDVESASVKSKINKKNLTAYSLIKLKTEELITKNLTNYVILRFPLVLSNIRKEPFIFNVNKNKTVEVLTNKDAGNAICLSVDNLKKLNKKTFNVGGGEKYIVLFKDILNNVLKNYGLTFKYILSRIFLEKTYNSPVLTDSDDLENLIYFRNDTLQSYYSRLKRKGRKRNISRLLGKLIVVMNRKR